MAVYPLLLVAHLAPAAGALVADVLGSDVLAHLAADLAAHVLHEQKVGCQGALGGVGVWLALLPLGLVFFLLTTSSSSSRA